MSKERNKQYTITRIRQELQDTCYDYQIINKKTVQKHENQLYEEEYLPRLLLYELDDLQYIKTLKDKGIYDDYIRKMLKMPHKTHRYNEIQELKEWVKDNKKYSNILNKKECETLEEHINVLKQFYEEFMKKHFDEKIDWDKLLK